MVVFTWREMEGERTAGRHLSSQKELGTVPHEDEDEIMEGCCHLVAVVVPNLNCKWKLGAKHFLRSASVACFGTSSKHTVLPISRGLV
jgi:hypothetical protein